jgi:Flp pilus assembly protein protease CpaA
MTIYLFIALMIFFCITDIIDQTIPNWTVLPGIILGVILTGHWVSAISMFCIGAYLFRKRLICGGDVKLMAMVGSFLGVNAIFAFILSKALILVYRKLKDEQAMLPYAPFISIACIPFLFM